MKKNIIISFLILLNFSCKKNIEIKESLIITNGIIEPSSLNKNKNLSSLPEDFLNQNGIDDWESFKEFQDTIENISKLNPNGLGVFLNGLSKEIEKLEQSDFPVLFDKPQVLSRLKLIRMQALKSRYFTKNYTKDSLEIALNELYQYYNSLIDRILSISEEEVSDFKN